MGTVDKAVLYAGGGMAKSSTERAVPEPAKRLDLLVTPT